VSRLRSYLIVAAIYAALGVLIFAPSCAQATVYDPQQAKGYPPLSDSDSVKVRLFSWYADSTVVIDEVRMPKPEKDAEHEYVVCMRFAPARIAQCVVRLKTIGLSFAIEVPLNLQEV
jgi:hypothetical protein